MQITEKFACGRRNENKDNLSIKQRQIEREIQKNRKQTQYSTWSHIGMTDKSDRGKREEGKKIGKKSSLTKEDDIINEKC